MNSTMIMTLDEVVLCVKDIKRRRRNNAWQGYGYGSHTNLIIFRLATCCGLRRGEIATLTMGDLILKGSRPCIIVRKVNSKGRIDQKKSRHVPLWWDSGTLEDLQEWFQVRLDEGAGANDYVVVGLKSLRVDPKAKLDPSRIAKRFKNAIRALGPERVSQISVHGGRHTFASLALQAGRSLAEVKEALGHRSISTTSIYLHAIPTEGVPDIFSGDRLQTVRA